MYVILLGLPGAGKGTQAARLHKETGLVHVTTGELFRENIRSGTELGKKARPFVEGGLLVPDEITIGMLLDRIGQPDCTNGCMLDGFPRTMEQAKALDEALENEGKQIARVAYIKVAMEELVSRLAGRLSCRFCGAVYHEQNRPPKVAGVCDNCGAELHQREDDKLDVVRTRLEVNLKNLTPMLEYYREQGKLREVDGEGDVEAVARDLAAAIGEA